MRDIEKQTKQEHYHMQDATSVCKVCVVGTNREHVRRMIRQRREGSTGAKLLGMVRGGMSVGFVYYGDPDKAWEHWIELLNDRTTFTFVQTEQGRDEAINEINPNR